MSYYFAEFWNSVTNLPGILVALILFVHARRLGVPARITFCYWICIAMFLGSFLFHMTMTHEMQMLDEFPMLLLVSQLLYCIFVDRGLPVKYRILCAVFFYGLGMTGAVLYLCHLNALLFQSIFAALLNLLLVKCIHRCIKIDSNHHHYTGRCAVVISAASFLAGFALWLYDFNCCHSLRHARTIIGWPFNSLLQFHGWWHLLTSLGALWIIAGFSVLHADDLEVRPFMLFLPRLVRVHNKRKLKK